MKTTMIKVFNNSGYDHRECEFKRFNHKGILTIDSAIKIINRKFPKRMVQPVFDVTKFELTIFDGSKIISSEIIKMKKEIKSK